MIKLDKVQYIYDGEGERNPPLSRAEALIQAHPDITVIRDLTGEIEILQTFPDKWRHITVDIEHEEDSQHRYPTVLIRAWESPPHTYPTDNLGLAIRRHGLE